MILEKIEKELKGACGAENDIEIIALIAMECIDRVVGGGYIKSISIDDLAYNDYLSGNSVAGMDLNQSQGKVRRKIVHLVRNAKCIDGCIDWKLLLMQIMYVIDGFLSIRNEDAIGKDADLVAFFNIVDKSRLAIKDFKNVV